MGTDLGGIRNAGVRTWPPSPAKRPHRAGLLPSRACLGVEEAVLRGARAPDPPPPFAEKRDGERVAVSLGEQPGPGWRGLPVSCRGYTPGAVKYAKGRLASSGFVSAPTWGSGRG
jgi:hypothetical protein